MAHLALREPFLRAGRLALALPLLLAGCHRALELPTEDLAVPSLHDAALPTLDAAQPGAMDLLAASMTCEPGTVSGQLCDNPPSVCITAVGGCCACGNFAQTCAGIQWTCATPSQNPPGCPAALPQNLGTCIDTSLECWYCTADGPVYARCSKNDGLSGCPQADAPGCWGEAASGLGCD